MKDVGVFVLVGSPLPVRLKREFLRERISFGPKLPNTNDYHTVFYWGHSLLEDKEVHGKKLLQLNSPSALTLVGQKERLIERLSMHGLDVHLLGTAKSEQSRIERIQCYKVLVFHLQAISIYKGFQRVPLNPQSRHQRLLVREAIKAVYAAGLDFAEVEINVKSMDRHHILSIEPAPHLNQQNGADFVQALVNYDLEYAEYMERNPGDQKQDIVLGSDCEFLLCDKQGSIVSASKYLDKKGRVGCDGVMIRGRGMIYPLAELRTTPSQDYRQQVLEILHSMRVAEKIIHHPELSWLAGGMPVKGLTLGGHLHVSGVWLNAELLRVLDNYLTLPFMLLEDASSIRRRPRYGFLGDFRRKSYGGFEYRCLPSWIFSPQLALGVCAMMRYLVECSHECRQRPLQSKLQTSFYEGDQQACLPAVQAIWQELRQKRSFQPYLKHVEPMFKKILRMEVLDSKKDIRNPWKRIHQSSHATERI